MLKELLTQIEGLTGNAVKNGRDANSAWVNEWAKLFLKAFEPDKKVVYTSVYAFPMEILAAFDIIPFDFEFAGALVSTTEKGVQAMTEAEKQGYSMDVCSFHRTSMGVYYKKSLPKPDLFTTTSHFCDGKMKTNDTLSHLFKKESLLLYVPPEITKDSIKYVEKQLRQITNRIGEVVGQEFDEDRFKQVIRDSNRSRKTHLKFLDLLKHCPAPWGGKDLIIFSIGGYMFSGSEVKERLNQEFIDEMEEKIKTKNLKPEKHRLYWFAWFTTYPSNLFEVLAEKEVTIPLVESFKIHGDEIDEDNPFEGLALKCLKNPFVGPASRRIDDLKRIKDEYNIDGTVLFATPACRHSKSTYRLFSDASKDLGMPFLMLDIDISDPRGYSPEQVRTRLEGYIELLDQRKQAA